jgi:transforming growth factor-beta-induced protein
MKYVAVFFVLILAMGSVSAVSVKPWFPQGNSYVFECSLPEADSYNWFFGDGQKIIEVSNSDVYHTYAEEGYYTVTCENEFGSHSLDIVLGDTIVDVAEGAGIFGTLLAAVDIAMLRETLESEGPFTVFAPTNEAFEKLDPVLLETALNDKELLTQILLYHVVLDDEPASSLLGKSSVTTAQGSDLALMPFEDTLKVNDVLVEAADVPAVNGRVHIIDHVLLPPMDSDDDPVEEPADASLQVAQWYPKGKEFVFQCDAGFEGARYNWEFGDGNRLHEVANDNVFHRYRVSGTYEVTCEAFNEGSRSEAEIEVVAGDIAQVAEDNGFSTLLVAVDAAMLTDALKGQGPLTVFAPTNEAFGAIPTDNLAALLNDTVALTDVLLYHIVPGQLDAAAVAASPTLETLQGGSLTVSTTGGVFVDGVEVVLPNVPATNGIVHVINEVLMP